MARQIARSGERALMPKGRAIALTAAVLLVPFPLWAQFAPPDGGCPPGMHLEGFSCVYDQPVELPPQAPPSAPEWVSFYAAVAWADSDEGQKFIGVEKIMLDDEYARQRAMSKCQAKRK